MATFEKLNLDWNADPNSPMPQIAVSDRDIVLSFYLNAFIFEQFREDDIGRIRFANCSRYRMGSLNDHGWDRGQGRFSKGEHKWGEFYEVSGDLILDKCPNDWIELRRANTPQKHFLFYFRDEDFECDADGWNFSVLRQTSEN